MPRQSLFLQSVADRSKALNYASEGNEEKAQYQRGSTNHPVESFAILAEGHERKRCFEQSAPGEDVKQNSKRAGGVRAGVGFCQWHDSGIYLHIFGLHMFNSSVP
jgi:hypothetical protein